MADTSSFDIVSIVDLQEVDNALNQARKEIIQRYDFKGSKSSLELKPKEFEIVLISDDDFRMKAVVDILQSKFVKRGVPLKALKLKVQAQIMDAQVRVSGKSKDDLQAIMALVRAANLSFAVQFQNYR